MTLLIVDFREGANLEKTLEAQERVVKGGGSDHVSWEEKQSFHISQVKN